MKLYTARWLCTVSSPAITNGCVAVTEEGEIAFAGPRISAPAGVEYPLGDVILVPGLVNVHSHLDLTVLRGMLSGPDFFSWIRSLVELKTRFLDDEILFASSCAGVAEGIAGGITSYGDTSDSDAPLKAMCRMGVRGVAFQEVFGPDDRSAAESMEGLRARIRQAARFVNRRVRLGVSPHAPYSVSDTLFRECASYATEERLPMAVHIAESAQEWDYVVNGSGPFAEHLRQRGIDVEPRAESPIGLLRKTGVLDTRPLLIHAVRTTDDDRKLIRDHHATVAHCPASNAKLGHGAADVLQFLRDGIEVALGTDSVVANNRMDMLEEARIACFMQRGAAGRGDILDGAELLEMLTIRGARALGVDGLVGTLQPGKRADMAAFVVRGAGQFPMADPADALIHTLRGADADFVMVDGTVLMRNGRLTSPLSVEHELLCDASRRIANFRH